MDWISKGYDYFKKYRYVILVLAIGLVLMLLPERTETETTPIPTQPQMNSEDTSQQLEDILSQIQGAGRVKVLLTRATEEEILYQTNEDESHTADSSSIRQETVIIANSDRGETGLIQTVIPPTYLGAIIVCQGADSPTVKLSIVEAVSNATGLGTDRITVLKMK